ncbi:MAG: hypothetical protein IIY28_09610 [Lachnospiraceae bacterium]|nr:hypothetical protein [Lachnospiraceae bacterium]MBQ1364373.1 hypothetical protein [Clostridia bacterium]
MAFTDEGTGTTMLVQPSGFGGNSGFGFGDGNGWWILLLFILMGGWGGNFGGGFGGVGGDFYPWMNQSNQISSGFQSQMLNDNITGIQNSLNGISSQLCNNQMADLERSFAAQTANTAGMNAIQSQLANCCCENRAATADLKYTVATEACADRNAISSALRDVLSATQAQTQTILDKMCQQEIDALKSQNIALQNQVNMQALAASQTAQTAQLIADNTAQTQYIVNRVAPYPIPAYTVANPVTPAI